MKPIHAAFLSAALAIPMIAGAAMTRTSTELDACAGLVGRALPICRMRQAMHAGTETAVLGYTRVESETLRGAAKSSSSMSPRRRTASSRSSSTMSKPRFTRPSARTIRNRAILMRKPSVMSRGSSSRSTGTGSLSSMSSQSSSNASVRGFREYFDDTGATRL